MTADMTKCTKNFVLLGETGSGKSEIALNIASELTNGQFERVCLFDLDQSKPLFRVRDLKKSLEQKKIELHYGEQFWDSPIVSSSVVPRLKDANSACILDIGGGENAARVVGCFNQHLKSENTTVFYVINPFRPYSSSVEAIDQTMRTILIHSRLREIQIVANPNFGSKTTAEDVLNGVKSLCEMLPKEAQPKFVCVNEKFCKKISDEVDIPIFPIKIELDHEWTETEFEEVM